MALSRVAGWLAASVVVVALPAAMLMASSGDGASSAPQPVSLPASAGVAGTPPPPPLPPSPVSFLVAGVGCNGKGKCVALLEFGGDLHVVTSGTRLPDDAPAMVVQQISKESIEVLDLRTGRVVRKILATGDF